MSTVIIVVASATPVVTFGAGWWLSARHHHRRAFDAALAARRARMAAGVERGRQLTARIDALTAAMPAVASGSDLPPRGSGLPERPISVPPEVTQDTALILAEHIPTQAMETLAQHGEVRDRTEVLPAIAAWVDPHDPLDVVDATDDPPRDEARIVAARNALETRIRDDDEPPTGGPVAELTATIPQPRYRWAHLSGQTLPPSRGYVLPQDWYTRIADIARSRTGEWPCVLPTPTITVRRTYTRVGALARRTAGPVRLWATDLVRAYTYRRAHRLERDMNPWADCAELRGAEWEAERREEAIEAQRLIQQATGTHWTVASIRQLRQMLIAPPADARATQLPELRCQR